VFFFSSFSKLFFPLPRLPSTESKNNITQHQNVVSQFFTTGSTLQIHPAAAPPFKHSADGCAVCVFIIENIVGA